MDLSAPSYTIAGVTVQRQALMVAVLGALSSVALVILALFSGVAPLRRALLLLALANLATTVYGAYVTNCALTGRCVALSWLFVAMYALNALWVPVMMALLVAGGGRGSAKK